MICQSTFGWGISTIGAYHLLRWITEFSYLDAMSYDTPILDREIHDALSPQIASFAIADRLERARTFRKYLSKAWHSSNLAPSYFDWASLLAAGEESFARVKNATERTGYLMKMKADYSVICQSTFELVPSELITSCAGLRSSHT